MIDMKLLLSKTMKLFYTIAIIALTTCIARAATLQTDFSYDDQGIPELAAIEYRLYMDGDSVCQVPVGQVVVGPNGSSFDCIVSAAPGHHLFTIRALIQRGTLTGYSNEFPLYIAPEDPVEPNHPILIRVQVSVEGANATVEQVQ